MRPKRPTGSGCRLAEIAFGEFRGNLAFDFKSLISEDYISAEDRPHGGLT
jgi:hypothetical protein